MNREQCVGCIYWRRLCGGGGDDHHNGYFACHYLLLTDMRRKVDENNRDICLSRDLDKSHKISDTTYKNTRTNSSTTGEGYKLWKE